MTETISEDVGTRLYVYRDYWDNAFQSKALEFSQDTGIAHRHFHETRYTVRRKKPIAEFLKPLPYEVYVESDIQPLGNLKCNFSGNWYYKNSIEIDGNLGSYIVPVNAALLPDDDAQRSAAIIAALLKLKQQKVNLAQAYAERKMTAQLVGDTLERIANGILALRKRKWKEAWRAIGKKAFNHAPRTWLEYQYGWRPLMADVFGSVEALKKNSLPSDWLVTVEGKRKVRYKDESLHIGGASYGPYVPYRNYANRSLGYKAVLSYQPGNSFLATVASLGLTNPLQLAWELVPYSFVVDWFYPIGNWLAAMDAAAGMEFYCGSISSRKETKVVTSTDGQQTGYVSSTGLMYHNDTVTGRHRRFHLKREVLTSSPLPSRPQFKDPLSLTHVANGLSLLTQALGSGPPRLK